MDDPIAPDATRSLSARTFGEAAINLSGSGIFGSNVCQTFGSAYLKSRSSDSFTAAAKDFISPIPVVISNCGSITLKKVTEPAGSTQTFAFAASGSPSTLSPAAPSLSGAAGSDTQVYSNLQAGSYTFTEGNQLAATWDLATSISCKLADGITDASFTSGERTATVSLAASQAVTCTFTNSRKPTLTVNKVCVPAADSGKFDLKIGSTVYKADATCAGGAASSTGAVPLSAGNYSVSEAAGTGTSLSNYAQLIGGDCAADGSVSLAAGENKVCSITNSRKPTLTVNKVCVPAADSGKFDLKIGSTVYKADATCAGGAASSTGAVVLDPGSYSVSEAAGTGTSLSNYAQLIGGDCAADGSVSLAAGENKVCSITNSRKPTLTVNKVCVPAADSGKFDLKIGSTVYKADATCAGGAASSTGAVVLDPGSYSVSEAAGTGTSLSNYAQLIGGDCAADGSVSLAAGENKVCSITNSRKPTLTVNKVCVPAADSGLFKLQIDGTAFGGNASNDSACGGSTGAQVVSTGSHTVSEAAGANTSLSHYTSVINGDCSAAGAVSLAYGENKTCTITNTKRVFKLIVLVCAGNSLYRSEVTLTNGVPSPGTKTLVSPPAGVTAAELCGLGGAAYDVGIGSFAPSVTIGAAQAALVETPVQETERGRQLPAPLKCCSTTGRS